MLEDGDFFGGKGKDIVVSIIRETFDSTENAGFAVFHLIEEGAGGARFAVASHRSNQRGLLYQVDGADEQGVTVDGDVFCVFHKFTSFDCSAIVIVYHVNLAEKLT